MITLRRILRAIGLTLLPVALNATAAQPQRDYATVSAKAERFFKYQEWANAAAMYEIMMEDSAHVAGTYSSAIAVAGMRQLPDYQMSVFERSQKNLVPMTKVLDGVREVSFSLGKASLYENFLQLLLKRHPWLGRSIDKQLLDYYILRRDGKGIVDMSRIMLSTAPGNTSYLNSLADGLILQGKYDEAVNAYRQTLAMDPNNMTALLALGNYLLISEQPDEALPYLRRANAIAPSPYIAELISQCDRQ
ncbi:tetratricopeptide repeat protein [uncultured Muribaculum sp.]|uniref:tetratricopeptide repeat protein n=1 Tax=uncultured Muribaculum sp. TaxID=1918613 RepID=UPI0025B04102|nr:tetratricopeptide repeat protein [uncultured Muribaculum sp.]